MRLRWPARPVLAGSPGDERRGGRSLVGRRTAARGAEPGALPLPPVSRGHRAPDRTPGSAVLSRPRDCRVPVRGLVQFGKGLVGVMAAIGLWQLLLAVGVLPSRFVPSMSAILVALVRGIGSLDLLGALGGTLEAWAIGLAIATLLGAVAGIGIATVPRLAAMSSVVIRFLRPVPSVALIPIAILVAGLGLKMTLILVVFASLWPVLFNATYAVRDMPQLYRETGLTLGLGRAQLLLRVVVPASLPGILTGIRIASAIGLVVAVSAELVTGVGGLGGYILNARQADQIPAAYAGILLGGLTGYLINFGLQVLERRAFGWSTAGREGA